jgi:hypothetical protein
MMQCATRLLEHLVDRPVLAEPAERVNEPIAYSATQAAQMLGVSADRMYELAPKGECPAVLSGPSTRET